MAYPFKNAGNHTAQRFWYYKTVDKRGPKVILILIILCILAMALPDFSEDEVIEVNENLSEISSQG